MKKRGIIILLVAIFVICLSGLTGCESETDKIVSMQEKLNESLDVGWIFFVDGDTQRAFVLTKDNQYQYATEEQLQELQKVFDSLSETQKDEYFDSFSISNRAVERYLLCQELEIENYIFDKDELNATIQEWQNGRTHKESMREATLEELAKIKEFEASH